MEENKNIKPHTNNGIGMGMKSIYEDEIFKVPFDKVQLPSGGLLYGNEIPEILDVEYVTAKDEDILYSSELMSTGQIFNILVKEKVKNKQIKVEDLLIGDFNEILLFLRKSAYGNIYNVSTFDPDTQRIIKQPLDLNLLERKPIGAQFDERGEFEFVLPTMNKHITFKLINVGMMDFINNKAEQMVNKITGVKPFIKCRLESQIMSVDGHREKFYISRFVDVIPPMDRLALMKYMEQIECGPNLNYAFKSSIKGNEYTEKITLALDFFYPSVTI